MVSAMTQILIIIWATITIHRITSIFLVDFDGDGRTDILESSEPPNLESKRYSPAKWYRNANSDDNANTLSHFEMLEFGRFTREGYFNDRNDGKFIIAGTFDGDASINVLVVGHNNNIFSLKSFKSNDLIIRKKEQITSLFGVEVYQQDPQSSFSGAATCREYNKFAINVPPHSIISTRRNEPYFKAGNMLSFLPESYCLEQFRFRQRLMLFSIKLQDLVPK